MLARFALIATALATSAFAASASASAAVRAPASQQTTRMIVAQTGETSGDQPGARVTARLADGADLEMKWLQGGVLVSTYFERGENIEASTQSITYAEAKELRDLIRNSERCPVELALIDSQITQAKSLCGER